MFKLIRIKSNATSVVSHLRVSLSAPPKEWGIELRSTKQTLFLFSFFFVSNTNFNVDVDATRLLYEAAIINQSNPKLLRIHAGFILMMRNMLETFVSFSCFHIRRNY